MNPTPHRYDTFAPPDERADYIYRSESAECVRPSFPVVVTAIIPPRRSTPAQQIADIIWSLGDEPERRGEAELSCAVFARCSHKTRPVDWPVVVALLERMRTPRAADALAIARAQLPAPIKRFAEVQA